MRNGQREGQRERQRKGQREIDKDRDGDKTDREKERERQRERQIETRHRDTPQYRDTRHTGRQEIDRQTDREPWMRERCAAHAILLRCFCTPMSTAVHRQQ